MSSGNLGVLYGAGGLGSCLVALLLLYNLVGAVLFLREETDGVASPMAKAAWAVGVLAVLGWWFPCVGAVLAIVAIVLAQIERGRIYRDESTFAGSTPIRMGRIDGIVVLVVQVLLIGAMVASAMRGGVPTI
jgi:hypothetical protein